jgi:RHS repeat-associated protein
MHLTNFHFYNPKNYLYSKPVKGLQGYGIGYCFSFNGQEKDDEVSGAGNTMSATFWEYDADLGRRWNCDPLTYPWQSSYAVFNNNPIFFIDPSGLEGVDPPGAPKNPCPGDKYKHKDDKGTEWEYEYKEDGWQGTGGTNTKPLRDVVVGSKKSPSTNNTGSSYQDWYNKYKKPEIDKEREQWRQTAYQSAADYAPSTDVRYTLAIASPILLAYTPLLAASLYDASLTGAAHIYLRYQIYTQTVMAGSGVTVLLGRYMDRVINPLASANGYTTITNSLPKFSERFMEKYPNFTNQFSLQYNRFWVQYQMKSGSTILMHTNSMAKPGSDFMLMEIEETLKFFSNK